MSLEITDLNFSYARKQVLHNVNLRAIASGTVTALIGPNAAGKSTLFRCIAGMLKGSGAITLSGTGIAGVSQQDWSRRVCFMPQTFTSNAALTVFEIVLLARKHMAGWRVTDPDVLSVAEMLRKLDIEHLSETHVGDLSGGQQQMVSIAQALVRDPDLFLLDEPTSALDLRHQLEIMTTIRSVTADRDITTIVALHDLNLAARFASDLILMREGRVVSVGKPETILGSPELGDTYGVNIELYRTAAGTTAVAASL